MREICWTRLDTKEALKVVIILFLYGIFAPLLGLALKYFPRAQRWVFGLMCFMTIEGLLTPGDWGLTLGFFEYRGHAKGYHFYFAEVFAFALIIARALSAWKSFRLIPPGLWFYLLYCAMSFVSIVNAPAPTYACMAAFKSVKIACFFVAAYNFLRDEDDLHYFLSAMGVTMLWEFLVVLKMKYLEGVYQVPGTFLHQNALSMFTTMIGLVFLAAALGPKSSRSNFYLVAFFACAFIQESTLSRAGLAIFAAGTVLVAFVSLIEKITTRRLVVLGALAVIGGLGLLMTIDTIIVRFHDDSNVASNKTRELLNEASRQMLEDHWLGIGWNNFGVAINKPFPYGDVIDRWEKEGGVRIDETYQKGIVESHYWLLLSETGYQGLLFYLLFVFVFLWRNARAFLFFRHHFLGCVSLGIFAGCLFNYLQGFVERVLTQERNLLLWMLLLGVSARIHAWLKEARKQKAASKSTVPSYRGDLGYAETEVHV